MCTLAEIVETDDGTSAGAVIGGIAPQFASLLPATEGDPNPVQDHLDLAIELGDLKAAKDRLRGLRAEREQLTRRLNECGRTLPTAEELMPANVHVIHRGSTLALAAATMAELKIHRLIAIDDGGVAVGMLSSLDVMYWLAERAGYVLED